MMITFALIEACTIPEVSPKTVAAIIQVESGGDPQILHINNPDHTGWDYEAHITSEGVTLIKKAIAGGASVDIGLMQVNTKNVMRFGYKIEDMLDPCKNIKAGSRIIYADYAYALTAAPAGQVALRYALSAYNTGNFQDGFENGYVAKYYNQVPSIPIPREASQKTNPLTADTTIYRRSNGNDSSFTSDENFSQAAPPKWGGNTTGQ